jgi:putative hydrolase of the HAD superfamily
MNRISAVIFDMDGVVRHWDPDQVLQIENQWGLPPGSIEKAALEVPQFSDGLLGNCTFDEWCDSTAQLLAQRHGLDKSRSAISDWKKYRGTIDPQIVDIVEGVRQVAKVSLLSNAHDCLTDDLYHHGLENLFDSVTNSSSEGIAKPDSRIYLNACETLGIPPSECLFIDDRAENVRGAKMAGLFGIHFLNRQQLLTDLRDCGLNLPL